MKTISLAGFIFGQIRKSSQVHMAHVLYISGAADIPGCDHRFHSRRVGMPGPWSAGVVQGRDIRELPESGLLG